MQYYFLASRLPPLALGELPDITWEEFLFLLETNLTRADWHWVNVLRLYQDLINIRHFWLGEAIDPIGRFNELELEEALLTGDGFPDYVDAFLEQHPSKEERLKNLASLTVSFFTQELRGAPEFLRDYLQLERELRLVFLGFRAKKLGRNLATELQFENPDDDLIAQLLAQKDDQVFEPPEGFESLRVMFTQHSEEPMALFQDIAAYRFNWIEERLTNDTFSISRILGYMVQLILVLQTLQLDAEKGNQMIDTMVKEFV